MGGVASAHRPRPSPPISLPRPTPTSSSDPFKPIYLAVKGVVYDVTKGRAFYGRGGGYAALAGREVARALAKMSMEPADVGSANLDDCTPKELETLSEWEGRLKAKYAVAGKVVAPVALTLAELATFDGADNAKPMYIAIRGTIFDVSTGKDFYGPDGMYPFAGRECARAFALISTDLADCNADLTGLGAMELDNLRDWTAKFEYKYPIVGRVVEGK